MYYNFCMGRLHFDTLSGALTELPVESTAPCAQAEALLPLTDLLTTPDFPFSYEDFERPTRHEWDMDHVKAIGAAIVGELAALDQPASLTKRRLRRLHILGILPSYSDLESPELGGYMAFKEAVDPDPRRETRLSSRNEEYADLTLSELADVILNRYNALVEGPDGRPFGGPITTAMVRQLNGLDMAPSPQYIQTRFGSKPIAKLNETLGFPDVLSWDKHDYITYGASVLRHNGPGSLTQPNIFMLAKQHYGPHVQAICTRFSWTEFQELSRDELDRQLATEQAHRVNVETYYETAGSDLSDIPFEEKAQYRALSILLKYYDVKLQLPKRMKGQQTNSTVMRAIHHVRSAISLGEIESTAVMLDLANDLWPAEAPRRPPILTNLARHDNLSTAV